MNCSGCGAENREGRRFCASCGAALAAACPECGFVNEAAAKYCGGCGHPLALAETRSKAGGAPAAPLSRHPKASGGR